MVTDAPSRARQAPIRPPTPPAPRIACRKTVMRASLLLRRCRYTLQNLGLGQRMVALLGPLVDAFYDFFGRRNAAPLKPPQHIRLSAHRTNVNNLIQSEQMRWDARVDAVRQNDEIGRAHV